VLSEAEIKTLWANIDKIDLSISNEARSCLKLILLTAQRPGEVLGMHSTEIDGQWWTIPAERAKNGKAHRVYLSPLAQKIVVDSMAEAKASKEKAEARDARKNGQDKKTDDKSEDKKYNGFVFPSPLKKKNMPIGDTALAVAVGRNLAMPLTDANDKPLYDKEGKPATENLLGVDHFTPHDLRRTAATFMAGMGYMDEIIDAVLNHVKRGIIRTYNRHDYDKEKQQALEAWERKLNSIISSKESNVVPMIRKAA
jgi:integrase